MNKLKIGVLSIALSVLGLVSSAPASAAMMGLIRPEIVGGINDTLNTGFGLGWTAGLDLSFWMSPAFDLTVGGEYLSRHLSSDFGGGSIIHIPALLGIHLGPMLAVEGGGFYDVALTSGASANYGITGGAKISLPALPLYLEGRYNYGLDTGDQGTNSSELEVLVGIKF
jgi:hypothetical protein